MSLPTYAEYYLRTYGHYMREHRLAGSSLQLFELAQPAGDFSDKPTPDLVVIRAISSGISQRSDLGGGRFEARSRCDDLFLVAPHSATDILVHNEHVIQVLAVPGRSIRPVLEEMAPRLAAFDFGRLHAGPFRNVYLARLMQHLWASACAGDVTSRLFADGAVLTLAAELVRQARMPAPLPTRALEPGQLRRVEDLLNDQLADDLPLTELALAVGLSPYQFARAFKAATGLPPHQWLMARRIERACELLAATQDALADIAYACGFASQSHMTDVFRAKLGVTPGRYRKERRS